MCPRAELRERWPPSDLLAPGCCSPSLQGHGDVSHETLCPLCTASQSVPYDLCELSKVTRLLSHQFPPPQSLFALPQPENPHRNSWLTHPARGKPSGMPRASPICIELSQNATSVTPEKSFSWGKYKVQIRYGSKNQPSAVIGVIKCAGNHWRKSTRGNNTVKQHIMTALAQQLLIAGLKGNWKVTKSRPVKSKLETAH